MRECIERESMFSRDLSYPKDEGRLSIKGERKHRACHPEIAFSLTISWAGLRLTMRSHFLRGDCKIETRPVMLIGCFNLMKG